MFDTQSLAENRTISPASQVSAFAVSPDGKVLAVVDGSYGISLIDVATGSELRSLPRSTVTSGLVSNSYLAFTPDGATLAAIVGEVVKLFSVATGEETGTIVATNPFNIAISPDGANLYAGGWMDEIQVWDIASGEKVRTFGEKSRGELHGPFPRRKHARIRRHFHRSDHPLGCGDRTADAHPFGAHRQRHRAWPFPPTAGCWPRPPKTSPSNCGMSRPVKPCKR